MNEIMGRSILESIFGAADQILRAAGPENVRASPEVER